jgi:hypothetical protein
LRSRRKGRLVRSVSLVSLVLTAWPASAVLAGDNSFNSPGDGSGYDNANLLRDRAAGCEKCEPHPPHEWDDPWFDLDWSLALRGSYVHTSTIDYFEAAAVPSVTLRHETLRGGYEVTVSADIVRSSVEEARLAAARVGFAADYRLDESTGVEGALDLAFRQASAAGSGVDPNILMQPQVLTGDGEVSVSRDVGPLVFTGRVNGSRTLYGPTTLVGPVLVDNSHQSNWTAGTGLRVGYRVTPILTAFVDGSVGYQWYDAPSPTLLVTFDAADYQIRSGLSAKWHDVLEGETSIGYGLRRFAEPTLGETSAILYDASLTFRPDETLEVKGAFATSFGAPGPDSGGVARLEYAATGDIGYVVNPWLKLRASAGWSHALLIGTADTESGWNAGAGADYMLNEFTTLTGDYTYSVSQKAADPPEDSHRVTVGVTFHD